MAENALDIFGAMKNAGLKDDRKANEMKDAKNSSTKKNATSNSKTAKKPEKREIPKEVEVKKEQSFMNEPVINEPVVTEAEAEKIEVVDKPEEAASEAPAAEEKTVEVKKNTTLTMLITEEQSNFLYEYHIKEGLFKKDAFEKIIMNEINNGSPDELAKEFRKIRHNNVKESLAISKELVDIIKESAKTYMLKTSAFVSYCLEKAMRESKEDK